MELKRVVVTGLGAITPVGNSVPEFWENLVNGVSGAGPITHFDASLFKTQFACEVKNFDATKYIDRKEARKMDRYTQLAVAVAQEAVSDSGLDIENEDSYVRRRSRQLRSSSGKRSEIQPVLHSQNDLGYCGRTDFHHVRFPWS